MNNNIQSAKIQRQGKKPTENKENKRNKHIYQWILQERKDGAAWTVNTHRDKGRAAYLGYRTVVVKKGGNFAKQVDITS